MAVSYMDYTSSNTQFTYDLKDNPFFKKDDQNYINALSINQLNTLGNVSLLDIFLSKQNVVEPHIHQNASELVYCISGAAVVSLINPFTKELRHFPIQPGQVANVPQGWWHYEVASVDNTHLLAVFDAPVPEFIGGSDLLRLTPASIFAHTYCLDEAKVKETLAPITDTVVIGPPADCNQNQVQGTAKANYSQQSNYSQPLSYQQFQQQQKTPNSQPLSYQQLQQQQKPNSQPLSYQQMQQQKTDSQPLSYQQMQQQKPNNQPPSYQQMQQQKPNSQPPSYQQMQQQKPNSQPLSYQQMQQQNFNYPQHPFIGNGGR